MKNIIQMVKRCQWGLCKSDTGFPERLECEVKFIPFPKPKRNLEKCLRWIKACERPHDQLNVEKIDGNYHMFVCTKHFPDEGPSDEYPDPYMASSNKYTPCRAPPKRRPMSEPPRKRRNILSEISALTNENSLNLMNPCVEENPTDFQPKTNTVHLQKEAHDVQISPLDMLAMAAELTRVKRKAAEQALENENLKDMIRKSQQSATENFQENKKLKQEIVYLKAELQPAKYSFTAESLRDSPVQENFKYNTGLSYEQFTNVYKF